MKIWSYEVKMYIYCTCTVIWKQFVVKILSWGRRTTKIKRMNICVQYTLRVFNYCGLPRTTKNILTRIHENISHEIFPNYGMCLFTVVKPKSRNLESKSSSSMLIIPTHNACDCKGARVAGKKFMFLYDIGLLIHTTGLEPDQQS